MVKHKIPELIAIILSFTLERLISFGVQAYYMTILKAIFVFSS